MTTTIGTIVDAAKFKMVKEELVKHFAAQTWSDTANVVMTFETLIEPSYDEPKEPDIPVEFIKILNMRQS